MNFIIVGKRSATFRVFFKTILIPRPFIVVRGVNSFVEQMSELPAFSAWHWGTLLRRIGFGVMITDSVLFVTIRLLFMISRRCWGSLTWVVGRVARVSKFRVGVKKMLPVLLIGQLLVLLTCRLMTSGRNLNFTIVILVGQTCLRILFMGR